jgi:hypothetical protein
MAKQGDFVGKASTMGKKLIIIVPSQYHNELQKVLGKHLKFHWEEIIEK